jgi:hypothetical protein
MEIPQMVEGMNEVLTTTSSVRFKDFVPEQTETVGGLPPSNPYPYPYSFSSIDSNSPTPQPVSSTVPSPFEVPFSAEHCFYRRTDP